MPQSLRVRLFYFDIGRKEADKIEKEHNMTLWEGIKLYPKAIGWSMLIRYVLYLFSVSKSIASATRPTSTAGKNLRRRLKTRTDKQARAALSRDTT